MNMLLQCEHESDGVTTWAELDGCTLSNVLLCAKYCEGVCCYQHKLHCLQTLHIVP